MIPDWAIPLEGDKSKWNPSTITLWQQLFSNNIHKPCGGSFEEIGSSGSLTHRIYYRCNRCGAQDSYLASADY